MITKINLYKLYKEFYTSENKLNEGLIKTYDIYSANDSINNMLVNFGNIDNISTIQENKIIVSLYTLEQKHVFKLLTLFNTLGYFISIVYITNKLNKEIKFTWEKFKDLYFTDYTLENFTSIKFELEPKYDIRINPNETVYHITEEKYLQKIFSKGLLPKNVGLLKSHPERLYIANTLDAAKIYLKSKERYYKLNGLDVPNFIILEINLKDLNINFYLDPNKIDGFYTLEPISKDRIKIYQEEH